MGNIVAIIGRPNVGKSTFFNRIVEKKISIVENIPGVTRDRIYEKVFYKDSIFNFIDTGGITIGSHLFNDEIKIQAMIAIDEADFIIFMVDGMNGMTQDEKEIINELNKAKKEFVVVANKVDNREIQERIYEFYELGIDKIIPISASHGAGTIDVLEYLYENVSGYEKSKDDDKIRFTLIGRPNVGKSTLFNALIGKERSIVSEIEGTTRDAINEEFIYNSKIYEIVDTAGIRKRGKVYEKIEKYSVLRSLKAIDEADVCICLIDGTNDIIEQDKKILGYAFDSNKPIIILVNKWDLVDRDDKTQDIYDKKLRTVIPFIGDAPIIFASSLNKKGINKIFPQIENLYEKSNRKFKTSVLNDVLINAIVSKSHPTSKGKAIKLSYITQVGTNPLTFIIFVNDKKLIHFSYKRYLQNFYKRALDLKGIRIKLIFRDKNEKS